MGQTLTEFIRDKVTDQALRDELLAELHWRGMDRDHGLIFEDSVEELDTPSREPKVGYRVQLRRSLKDKGRYQVTKVAGPKVTVVPMRMTADKRSWEVVPDADEQTFPADELMTVVTHTEKVFPGLISAGSVGPETTAPSHIAIRGENLHVLRALGYSHAAAVDLIYIDPPYNTGNKDWVYNDKRVDSTDGYRHSKWLAFMHRRLELARELLNPFSGALVVSIGSDEAHRLMSLLEQVFTGYNVQMITTQMSGGKPSAGLNYLHEYLICVTPTRFSPAATSFTGGKSRTPWEGLTLATFDKTLRPNQAYPIFVNREDGTLHSVGPSLEELRKNGMYSGDLQDYPFRCQEPAGTTAVWPITSKGEECVWRLIPKRFHSDWSKGYIKISPNRRADSANEFSVQYLPAGVIKKIASKELEVSGTEMLAPTLTFGANTTSGADIPTIWAQKEHRTTEGTAELKDTLGDKRFPYPKPVAYLADIIRGFSGGNQAAIIVDFFGGSGSTLEAVLRLNEEDGGTRQCIIATSNELGERTEKDLAKKGFAPGDEEWEAKGVFEYVLRPRTETILTGVRPDGSTYDKALAGDHRVEFFHLGYMDDAGDLDTFIDYDLMAPLLWARAGATGTIPPRPEAGEAVVGQKFAILFDTDQIKTLAKRVEANESISTVFIVAGSEQSYRQAASDLASRVPRRVETIHLERTYLDSRTWIPRDRRRRAN